MSKQTGTLNEELIPHTPEELKFWRDANDFIDKAQKDPSLIDQLEEVNLADYGVY